MKPANWAGKIQLHLVAQKNWEETMRVWSEDIAGEMVLAE